MNADGVAAANPIYRVTITNVDQVIDCRADQTILEAAVLAAIDYPFACTTGNCGSCISQVKAGSVSMLPRGDGALSAQQVESGFALACRSVPRSDVTITWIGSAEKLRAGTTRSGAA